MEKAPKEPKPARLSHALFVVVFLIAVLAFAIRIGATPHLPLVLATAVASVLGTFLGWSWKQIEDGLVAGVANALQACMILLLVGCLIGTWIQAGIVPTMIVYGLKTLTAEIFPFSACLLCSIVSLATGSSWSTAGTVGIALMGVGQGLGIPPALTAGAVVSGAYLGDKMSPLSDTTNLAPAVAGTDLFTHIRHMAYTTGPSFALALLGFFLLGHSATARAEEAQALASVIEAIESRFTIHPLLLLPPALVVAMVVFRWPALPSLFAGTIIGGLAAVFVQGSSLGEVIIAAFSGYKCNTGMPAVDSLLSRGGLENMLSTLALIICALGFGGVLERTGMLEAIARAILRFAKSTGSLVLSTLLTCIMMNIIASDQYLSIVVPGRMYRDAYRARGLHLKNLSRALEDAGTLSSPLVPWNTCGAFMAATLGVGPLDYLPFAFLNLLNPVISAFYGFSGLTMHKDEEGK